MTDDHRGVATGRKAGRPLGPNAPHYPNKAERKELIRLMKASGQTEAKVRASKKNRQLLAAAAASPCESHSGWDDRRFRILFRALKQQAVIEAKHRGIPIWEAQKEVGLYYDRDGKLNISKEVRRQRLRYW